MRLKRLRYHSKRKSKYSSPVKAINLIVVSKSLPVEVNNSAGNFNHESRLSVEAKEKLGAVWIENVYRSLKLTPG